ncbi:hypothetical protein PT974_05004 [Cladobotryum mycophilum]|uniref:Uncharacterized protein n=1 Tax=Cladobotryum mycophilum TaxID=491253 RepID=A0ABR0SQS4_9HYPO
MLDENFPSYRLQRSTDDPLHTVLFFTHNGSDPAPEYLIKRPPPANSRNQYALALFDAHYSSVIYGEVLVKPEWAQPTLSAAEARAQNGAGAATPVIPDSFSVMLYNPDQSIAVKRLQGGWNKSDFWGFEIPERTFRLPSASQLDQEAPDSQLSELSPKIVFHWKRDSRLSRDMTCYMAGRSVGGKKSKEPDITIAMYKAGKHDGVVSIYEPNMARVEVEDRKGLEVVLLLSAVVVRDLYISPRQDVFNGAGEDRFLPRMGRETAHGRMDPTTSRPCLELWQAEIDAETRRLQAMVAEEERQERERLAREEEEKTRRMLEREEEELRRQRQADVDRETERLRRQFGMPIPGKPSNNPGSPPLPPRQNPNVMPNIPNMSGALNSHPSPCVGPPGYQQPVAQENGRKKFGNPLGVFKSNNPYGNAAAGASMSNFFSGNREDERKKKIKKKQSVHF